MSIPLVLSLFPGIGLLDMAFEEAGFCVVRGPDTLWGGDIRRFHVPAGRFQGIIGGPPCQAFSRLRHIVEHNGFQVAPNLIPEYERIVAESAPGWFVMEEVPAAPAPVVAGYRVRAQLLRDVWVGGETLRMRRISFGTPDGRALPLEQLALHRQDAELSALASSSAREVPVKLRGGKGHTGKPKRKSALSTLGYQTADVFVTHLRKQGLSPDFLAGSPLTMKGKIEAVGNGVPLPMGRAIAKAVRAAMYPEWVEASA